jgi:hypothetical protein
MNNQKHQSNITSQTSEYGILEFHPSLITILHENFWLHLLLVLIIWSLLPIPYFLWKYFQVKSTKYILTNQRLICKTGFIYKQINFIELYRVMDIKVERGFLYQFIDFGISCLRRKTLLLGDIWIFSSDYSDPKLFINTIPNALGVTEKIRQTINEDKEIKRVIRRDSF